MNTISQRPRAWRKDVVLAVMAALEESFGAMPDYPPGMGPTLARQIGHSGAAS